MIKRASAWWDQRNIKTKVLIGLELPLVIGAIALSFLVLPLMVLIAWFCVGLTIHRLGERVIVRIRNQQTCDGDDLRAHVYHRMRVFGPKSADHPSVGEKCPACKVSFGEGDFTTLVPLGPGSDEEERRKAREERPYNAVAVEVHYACATGEDGRVDVGT